MSRPRHRPRKPRWSVGLATLGLVLGAGLFPAAPVGAVAPPNAVVDWNAIAVGALSNAVPNPNPALPPFPGQTPPVASIHLAMTMGAVYDAVNAIDGGHEAYLSGLPAAPASASKAAAAATAAHHVLVGVPLPAPSVVTSLNTTYTAYLAGITDSAADKAAGVAIGAAVAAAMLDDRTGDGRFTSHSFTPGTLAGQWRPELPAFVSDPFAWVAIVRPFTLTSNSQFRTAGPLDLASDAYTVEFNEVKALGAASNSSRTPAQTEVGRFYSANPLVMMNGTFRNVALAEGLTNAQAALLFVKTSMSSADALINCWDDKDHYSNWRPETAIREAGSDGNPNTNPNAQTWSPLFPTPPYPDHSSGYNCFSGAMMHTAEDFFRGDKVSIALTSPAAGLTNPTRTYKKFTAVLKDTIDARVFMGIHFRTADVQGAWLGKKVAKWVDKHFFAPTR